MSGIKIKLPKNTKIGRGGKITIPPRYRDASHAIRAKKSKKKRVVRRSI